MGATPDCHPKHCTNRQQGGVAPQDTSDTVNDTLSEGMLKPRSHTTGERPARVGGSPVKLHPAPEAAHTTKLSLPASTATLDARFLNRRLCVNVCACVG